MSIDALAIESDGTWELKVTSNIAGVVLKCKDTKCLEWDVSYEPTTNEEFVLRLPSLILFF